MQGFLGSWLGKTLPKDEAVPNRRQEGGKRALFIVSGINLLNFADRYVPPSVKELVQDDLHLSDLQSTYPTVGMVVVYMIFSIIFGILVDKNFADQRIVLACAITLWSIATATSGLAITLTQLVILRSLVGIGEAAYATIAPPLLTDFFPHNERNTVFGVFNICTPVGAALGFGIGGILGGLFGWRVAFLAVGFPGILMSLLALQINNPVRGINDFDPLSTGSSSEGLDEDAPQSPLRGRLGKGTANSPKRQNSSNREPFEAIEANPNVVSSNSSSNGSFVDLLRSQIKDTIAICCNPYYFFCVGGLCANNFAIGGLAEWFPSFLTRYDDFSIADAGLLAGAVTVVGGIVGTILGSKVAGIAERVIPGSYFLVPALFTIPAALAIMIVINLPKHANKGLVALLIFIAEIMVWTFMAPLNTVSISCIPVHLRSRSCGIMILLMHILGDVIAPPIIGGISTSTGSLRTGLQVTWIGVLVSGCWWFGGYYFLPPFRPPKQSDGLPQSSSSSSSSSSNSGKDVERMDIERSEDVEISFYSLLCEKVEYDRIAAEDSNYNNHGQQQGLGPGLGPGPGPGQGPGHSSRRIADSNDKQPIEQIILQQQQQEEEEELRRDDSSSRRRQGGVMEELIIDAAIDSRDVEAL